MNARGHFVNLNIDELKHLYREERKSTKTIAQMFGCGISTVRRRLCEAGAMMSQSEALRGHVKTEEHRKKLSISRMGTVATEQQREKMRAGMLRAVERGHSGCFKKGHKPNITPERNEKISAATLGKRRPHVSGDRHPHWKGGVNQVLISERTCEKSWGFVKRQVLKRDNKTCQKCGKSEGKIDIHHVTPWRLTHDDSMENLKTLCASCHRKEDARIAVNE